MHIRKLPVDELASNPESPDATPTELNPDTSTGEDFIEEPEDEVAAVLTMEEVLRQNDDLAQDSGRTVGETPAALARPLGPGESEEPPPVTEEELAALTRIGR